VPATSVRGVGHGKSKVELGEKEGTRDPNCAGHIRPGIEHGRCRLDMRTGERVMKRGMSKNEGLN
jgi:hypothetical protein